MSDNSKSGMAAAAMNMKQCRVAQRIAGFAAFVFGASAYGLSLWVIRVLPEGTLMGTFVVSIIVSMLFAACAVCAASGAIARARLGLLTEIHRLQEQLNNKADRQS